MTRRAKRIRSTGAESTPSEPVTTRAAIGVPVSTGTEPINGDPVTTRVTHMDEPVIVHSPTPGPVTLTVGWLADAETKVIEPAEQHSPAPARTSAQTKTTRTRGRPGDR